MARTTAEIQATMDAEQAAQPDLATLNSPSQSAIYTLFKYIVAKCQSILEGLWDAKQTQLETILAQGAVPSTEWARQKAYEFQYSATIPQTMELINHVPQYATVDTSLRIVTRSFAYNSAGITTLLVAKNEPPEKLAAGELTAIRNYYMNTGNGTNQAVGIGYAGQNISVYSYDPDYLFLHAEITYLGQYASTIQNDCILAIENYISNVGAYPYLRITGLVDALQKVDGFVDIFIHDMAARNYATAFGAKTYLIQSDATLLTEYQIYAGYMIGETTASNTLTDKLTFTSV